MHSNSQMAFELCIFVLYPNFYSCISTTNLWQMQRLFLDLFQIGTVSIQFPFLDHYRGLGTGSKHSTIKEIIMQSTWFLSFLSSAMRFALGFRFSLSFSLTFRNNYQRAAYFFLMHRVISQIASTMHTKYKIFVKDNFYAADISQYCSISFSNKTKYFRLRRFDLVKWFERKLQET